MKEEREVERRGEKKNFQIYFSQVKFLEIVKQKKKLLPKSLKRFSLALCRGGGGGTEGERKIESEKATRKLI